MSAALTCLIMCLSICAAPASGAAEPAPPAAPAPPAVPPQAPSRPDFAPIATSPEPTLFADIGWGSASIAIIGRWNPVRITLQGGTQAMSGTAVVEVKLNDGVYYRGVLPVVVTPNATVAYDMAAVFPIDAMGGGPGVSVVVSLVSESGRTIKRLEYVAAPDGTQLRMPRLVPGGTPLIVVAGDSTLGGWIDARAPKLATSMEEMPGRWNWSQVGPVPDLVVDPWPSFTAARTTHKALPTLMASYLDIAALVLMGEAIDSTSERACDAINEWVKYGGRLVLIPDRPGRDLGRWLPAEVVEVRWEGDGESSRVAVLAGEEALQHDWARITSAGETGVSIVHGRIGLGWAAVASRDPGRGLVSDDASGDEAKAQLAPAAWGDVLESVVGDHVEKIQYFASIGMRAAENWEQDFYRQSTSLDVLAQNFRSATLFPFWIFAAFVSGIAVLLGPVDRFLLRRLRLSRFAWLTAMGWLMVFGAVAYVLPNLTRAQSQQSAERTDRFIFPTEGLAWDLVASAFMTSSGTRLNIESAEPSLWRPLQADAFSGRVPSGEPLTVAQFGDWNPREVGVPVWSFRGFERQGPAAAAAIDGWVDPPLVEGDGWRIALRGVDPESVSQGWLEVGDVIAPLLPRFTSQNDGHAQWVTGLNDEMIEQMGGADWRVAVSRWRNHDWDARTSNQVLCARRLTQSGRWATVRLSVNAKSGAHPFSPWRANGPDRITLLLPVRVEPWAPTGPDKPSEQEPTP